MTPKYKQWHFSNDIKQFHIKQIGFIYLGKKPNISFFYLKKRVWGPTTCLRAIKFFLSWNQSDQDFVPVFWEVRIVAAQKAAKAPKVWTRCTLRSPTAAALTAKTEERGTIHQTPLNKNHSIATKRPQAHSARLHWAALRWSALY